MKNFKRTLTAIILAALVASLSGCENGEIPVSVNPESSSESSSVSESVPEISEPEPESEPESEPEVEPEPIPEPVITLSKTEVERGSYTVLRAENIDLSGVSFTDFLGYERSFFEKDGAFYCFIPVKVASEAGEYVLSFSAGDFEYSGNIVILDRSFYTQYLTIAEKTLEETLEDENVRAAFDYFYQNHRWYFSEEPLWNGGFVLPLGEAYYKETTPFGTFRTFSNGDTEYHNATDMAAPGGTPVYATNSGKILFAGWLGLTGNTILIDHGCGVISWHYHLSAIDIAEGDFVEKGVLIGKVGTTGLSTGNHLHFGLSVGGIFVDPMQMIGTEPDFDFGKAAEE